MSHKLQILKHLISFFILLNGFFPVFAQDNIQKNINNIEKNTIDGQFDVAEKELNVLLKQNNNNQLNKVIIYINFVNLYANENDYNNALKYANLAKEIADKTPNKLDDSYTSYAFAKLYLQNSMYDKTVYFSNEALKTLKKYPNENTLRAKIYLLLSTIHSRTGVYSEEYNNYISKAVFYAKESNSPMELLAANTAHSFMYYYKYLRSNSTEDMEKMFQNAELNLSILNQPNTNDIPNTEACRTYENLAYLINLYPYKNLNNNERYNLAEKYIKLALEYSNKINNNPGLKSSCYSTFAKIKEKNGDEKLAEEYYLKSYEIIKSDRNVIENSTINNVVGLISNFYEKNNQPAKALKFNKESLTYTQKAYEQANENKRNVLEAFYNFERKNEEINQLKVKNNNFMKQRFLYLFLIGVSVIGIVSLIYMINYRQKLNKQKTNLLKAEKHETALKLKLESEEKARLEAEQKLMDLQQKKLQKKALATSLQLNHKNSFISELKEKIKDDKNFNINKILKDERLMDEDFNRTQDIIKEVHPDFFNKLIEVSKSKLTNQDLKYAAYLYLNMDNTQISNLMKVETKTVRMAKYRLKQKIGLDKEVDLQTFIQNLFA
ncbi:hypothetical protein [Empedobacter brevis]|uniref:hypothetical protein n=1 Tax=Empedobacter brevis TaxID=247 RepID=UPI0039AF6D74